MAVEQQTTRNSVVIAAALIQPEWAERITRALPSNITRDRFMSAAISAVRNFRDIEVCDKNSVYNAVTLAAHAGLMLDGKQAALVKYSIKQGNNFVNVARYMPMVEGIIHQLGNAGISAYAVSVYANDALEIINDENGMHVKHVPVVFGDRGERVGALAAAKTSTGATYVEVLTLDDIKKVMKASKSRNAKSELVGPWVEWPDRMEQKSVLHRLAKRLPKPDGFVLADDPPEEDPEAAPPVDGSAVAMPEAGPPKKRPGALQAVVDSQREQPPPGDEYAGSPPQDYEEVI